jgi:fatty acid desaturase
MLITQVSHLQEEACPDQFTDSWAQNMLLATVDYSTDSLLWNILTGGLNCQALHHLIPGVSSSRYIELYPKFRKICAKHNIKIMEKKNLYEAVKGYLRWTILLSNDTV